MLREDLSQLVTSAVDRLISAGELPEAVRSPVEILDTKQPEHGDYACSFALSASKKAGMNPRDLADKLRAAVLDIDESGAGERGPQARKMVAEGSPPHADRCPPLIHEIEIAGPGFLNFRLKPEAIAAYLAEVLELGSNLPNCQLQTANCKLINVEFVSVNPNGPITVGSARGAAFGDTLCRVLEAAGNRVHREYYINDGVNSEQMRQFGDAVAKYFEDFTELVETARERSYKGEFVKDVAKRILETPSLPILFAFAENNPSTIKFEPLKLVAGWRIAQAAFMISVALDNDEVFDLEAIDADAFLVMDAARVLFEVYGREPAAWNKGKFQEHYFKALLVMFAVMEERGEWTSGFAVDQESFDGFYRDSIGRFWTTAISRRRKHLLADKPPVQSDFLLHSESAIQTASALALMLGPATSQMIQKLEKEAELEPQFFRNAAQQLMLHRQHQDLESFGVRFDTWFSEQSLHDSGEVAKCTDELITKGAADEEPQRIVLKLARGGVIEEVVEEPQTEGIESDDDGGGSVSGSVSPAPEIQNPESNIQNPPEPPSPTPSSSGAQTSPQEEGARTLWLRSTKFGDDMDRVLRRRDGRLTYIASDVAYHKDKLTDASGTRGTGPADKLITILGPDHHGYIHRLQAVLGALLEDPAGSEQLAVSGSDQPLTPLDAKIYRSPEERDACKAALEEARKKLEVVIFQIVRFVKDGKAAPMRKRDGNIYELRDLISEVGQTLAANGTKDEQMRIGADVARFFYLMRSHDSSMDFDIDLATKQSDENPVFYVQYAHARICSVIRKAGESGIEALGRYGFENAGSDNAPTPQRPNTSLLQNPRELTLIKKILDLPMEVQRCAEDYGVHRLTTYAIELARTYHHFYDACRVIQPEEPELSKARLALCKASRLALKATLDLLGVSAPEKMERAEPAA